MLRLSLGRGLPWAEDPRKPQAGWKVGREVVGLTHTLGPVLVGVVAAPTGQRVPLARVGAHGVDAGKACPTRLGQRRALVDVWRRDTGDGEPGTAPPHVLASESGAAPGGGRSGDPDQPWTGLSDQIVPLLCPRTLGPSPPRT